MEQRHRLVPEHIKLTEEEKKKLLEQYKVVEKNLPSIFDSDPAIKELGVVPGDVVKILRTSSIKGVSEYFRVVVHG